MKKKDYTNQQFGKLKVIGFENGKWVCECECGNIKHYTSEELQINKPKSCGCLRSPNLIEKKFDRLTVKALTDERDENYNVYWLCECDCGNFKKVTTTDLQKGNVKSCGCLADEKQIEAGARVSKYVADNYLIDGTNIKSLTSKIPKNNTSGYKGVIWDKAKQKWTAQIRFKGKNYHLGRYDKIEDAVKAREIAEEKIFGEFLEWYEEEKKNK